MRNSDSKKLQKNSGLALGVRLSRILDYFFPNLGESSDDFDSFRARILVFIYLVATPICAILVVVSNVSLGIKIPLVVLGTGTASINIILKFGNLRIKTAAIAGCFLIVSAMAPIAYFGGTIFSGQFVWFPVICIAIIFFNGIRTGVIFSGFLFAILLTSQVYFADAGLAPTIGTTGDQTFLVNAVCQFLSLALGLSLGVVFEIERELGLSRLSDSQEKVLHQQSRMADSARIAGLGELSAEISHEIKNPLTVIKSSAELIGRLSRDDSEYDFKMNRLLSSIDFTCNRINDIIRGLQSMARDGDGDPFVEVELSRIFKELEAIFQKRAKKSGVSLILIAGENAHLAFGRKSQIYQVTYNLIKNAIDALEGVNDQKKRVEVTTRSADDMVIIKVADSGPGISVEDESRVFDAFYTTKADGKGTGLGLSIAKKIIEEHEGEVYIDRGSIMSAVSFTLHTCLPENESDFVKKIKSAS